jgi:hypothetical protein
MANFFRCVAPARARKKPTHFMTQSINGRQLRALVSDLYIYTHGAAYKYIIDFQMRGANLRSICIGVYRASASLSLTLARRRRQFSEMQTRNAAGGPRALNCCVHYLCMPGHCQRASAQRDVVFPLGRTRQTRLMGAFSSSLCHGCIWNPFKALARNAAWADAKAFIVTCIPAAAAAARRRRSSKSFLLPGRCIAFL